MNRSPQIVPVTRPWLAQARLNLSFRCNLRSLLLAIVLSVQSSSVLAFEWADLWFTPDQQGQRLMDAGEYQQASGKFTTPESIGAALFLAGDFEKAASVFGRSSNAQAHYNRGNAHIMLGDYDAAIEAYQSALSKRPNWPEAKQNMEIAILRKQALAPPEDDFGGTGGLLGADEIVFDNTGRVNKSSNEQVIDAADEKLNEEAMRAMWLRKVETRPADFLAVRFNYQLATRDSLQPEAEPTDGEVNE